MEGVVILPIGIFSNIRSRWNNPLKDLGAVLAEPRLTIGAVCSCGTDFILNEAMDPRITHLVWEGSFADTLEESKAFCINDQLLRYMLGVDKTFDVSLEGIQIVTHKWVIECLEHKQRVPESDYRILCVDYPSANVTLSHSSVIGYSPEWKQGTRNRSKSNSHVEKNTK